MTGAIVTVSELTRSVKKALEGSFPFVWVRGQVSNCSRPSSGHLYFSLKDEDAVLNAVWFKGQQKTAEAFDPLTGEVFEEGPRPSLAGCMANGQEIVCAGRLTVYPPRGAYQLVVELAQDAGQGRLQREFERIKAALADKGYFDQNRKRPLPANPARIAIVTALAGAALRDFLRMAEERGIGGEIRIYPTAVQGAEAPSGIARAIQRAGNDAWAEVLVLIRGGGSLEDLWAFNTEDVAKAVFLSPIPVVTGIGHEVDVSIADSVADVRAATPTHAAQLVWSEKRELVQRVDEAELRFSRAWRQTLLRKEERIASLARALGWLSPLKMLARREEHLHDVSMRLIRATANIIQRFEISRDAFAFRLPRAVAVKIAATEHACDRLDLRLQGLDPMRPLERGYALARNAAGEFIRSSADAAPGELLELLLREGTLPVRVEPPKGNI